MIPLDAICTTTYKGFPNGRVVEGDHLRSTQWKTTEHNFCSDGARFLRHLPEYDGLPEIRRRLMCPEHLSSK